MPKRGFKETITTKLNVKSALLAISACLSAAGIYMCVIGLQSNGVINVKSSIIEGRVDTGSLGLLVIFLAILLAYAAAKISAREKSIELKHMDFDFKAKNMDDHEWEYLFECIEKHEEHHRLRESLKAKNT